MPKTFGRDLVIVIVLVLAACAVLGFAAYGVARSLSPEPVHVQD
ncbi:MAG: hypothetical protein WBA67_06325 [Jannaschia sp.]